MEGIIALVTVALLYGVWLYRRHVGAKALAEVERGQRCVACNGNDVVPEGAGVRCRKCGHFTDLAWLNRASVDPKEMAELAKPDGLRRR
jgi:hypothetical protein